jgi:hypothetical protein
MAAGSAADELRIAAVRTESQSIATKFHCEVFVSPLVSVWRRAVLTRPTCFYCGAHRDYQPDQAPASKDLRLLCADAAVWPEW